MGVFEDNCKYNIGCVVNNDKVGIPVPSNTIGCHSTEAALSVMIVFATPGEVPEWFKGTVLKTVVSAMVPRVRISPSPPNEER